MLDDRDGGEARVAELQSRLASLPWFMRCLAEPMARRANKEDGCTGRFWEGRFKSQALLDEQAVLSCSMYVDLNPIRAGVAQTPEASAFTSAKERIEARQAQEKLIRLGEQGIAVTHHRQEATIAQAEGEAGGDDWLCPIGSSAGHLPSLDRDAYLALLDWTGREVVANKRGAIPPRLAPILERLHVDVERWIETVVGYGRSFRRAAGVVTSLTAEAARVSRRWLHGLSAARRAFRVLESSQRPNDRTRLIEPPAVELARPPRPPSAPVPRSPRRLHTSSLRTSIRPQRRLTPARSRNAPPPGAAPPAKSACPRSALPGEECMSSIRPSRAYPTRSASPRSASLDPPPQQCVLDPTNSAFLGGRQKLMDQIVVDTANAALNRVTIHLIQGQSMFQHFAVKQTSFDQS